MNTTLGETWEEAVGEKLDHQVLMDKVVRYTAAVPARVVYLTAGIDSQRNRFEMYVWGWARERKPFWWIKSSLWGVPMRKRRCYVWMRRSTKIPPCRRNRNDHFPCLLGHRGIDGEIVYQRSKKHGVFRVLPVKARLSMASR